MKYIGAEKLIAEIKRLEEMDYPCDTLEQSEGFYDALDRIKSFIASLVEEEPVEWSEDDEKDMAHIIRILDDCYAYGKHDLSKTDHENLVNKLKSLRPQSKVEWSEKDEAMRDNILRLLSCFVDTLECDSNPSLSTSYSAYQKEIDWLKSLKPQRR